MICKTYSGDMLCANLLATATKVQTYRVAELSEPPDGAAEKSSATQLPQNFESWTQQLPRNSQQFSVIGRPTIIFRYCVSSIPPWDSGSNGDPNELTS